MDKVLDFAKKLIMNKSGSFDIAVDATCGRGNDTLFLAELFSKVYAFDIQEDAITSTKDKTKDKSNVEVILDSHENICTYVTEGIDAVMYNLGYLPNGDKLKTTKHESTLKSIEASLSKLNVDGIITIICYPGHEEGKVESIEIEKYLRELNQKEYDVIKYDFINQINNPPYLLAIRKR